MKIRLLIFSFLILPNTSISAPKSQNEGEEVVTEKQTDLNHITKSLEYHKYVQEMLEVMRKDPKLEEILRKFEAGAITADQLPDLIDLEGLHDNLRTELDEVKRRETRRLSKLAEQYTKTVAGVNKRPLDMKMYKEAAGHIDHSKLQFELNDLKKVIEKVAQDVEVIDERQQQAYVDHAVRKELQKRKKMGLMSEEERNEYEKKLREKLTQQQVNARKVHHPGSKAQFEQVWEELDHQNWKTFNPKTFFYYHDLNGDKFWDVGEQDALFEAELPKLYPPNENDDPAMVDEEMMLMRQELERLMDTNRDMLISLEEFMNYVDKADTYEKDEGWAPLTDKKFEDMTTEELEEYRKEARKYKLDRMRENSDKYQEYKKASGRS